MRVKLQLTQNDKMRILVECKEIGEIHFSERMPARLPELLKTREEIALVQSAIKPGESIHLEEILIYQPYRGKGYYKETLPEFELYCQEVHCGSVVLFIEEDNKEFYIESGYIELSYLESVDAYLMEKQFLKQL